jgi:hypothetical protein
LTDGPPLPVVWRPRTTRVIAYAAAGVLMLGMVTLAVVVAPQFKTFDRVMLVLFGLFCAWVLHMLARCRVVADASGLTVVNAFRTRRLAWAQIVAADMNVGDPWPTLDLADGTSISAMGINGAERTRAVRDLRELQSLLHARTPEPS